MKFSKDQDGWVSLIETIRRALRSPAWWPGISNIQRAHLIRRLGKVKNVYVFLKFRKFCCIVSSWYRSQCLGGIHFVPAEVRYVCFLTPLWSSPFPSFRSPWSVKVYTIHHQSIFFACRPYVHPVSIMVPRQSNAAPGAMAISSEWPLGGILQCCIKFSLQF